MKASANCSLFCNINIASFLFTIIFAAISSSFVFSSTYVSRCSVLYSENDVTSSQSRRNLIFTSLLMPISQIISKKADAACLPGDIREDCIGVYKMPLVDASLPYVETPEKLKVYAPDIKWVPPIEYPTNFQTAVNQLKEQRQILDLVQEKVAIGDIRQGGLMLLDVIPSVTSAGRYIVRTFSSSAINERNKSSDSDESKILEMKVYRIEYALNDLIGYLGETDVLIGMALRGELGVSAPAQIQILGQLGDARKGFDDLLRVIPEKF